MNGNVRDANIRVKVYRIRFRDLYNNCDKSDWWSNPSGPYNNFFEENSDLCKNPFANFYTNVNSWEYNNFTKRIKTPTGVANFLYAIASYFNMAKTNGKFVSLPNEQIPKKDNPNGFDYQKCLLYEEIKNVTEISIERNIGTPYSCAFSFLSNNPKDLNISDIVEGDVIKVVPVDINGKDLGKVLFLGFVTSTSFVLETDYFYKYTVSVNSFSSILYNFSFIQSQALYNQTQKTIKNESTEVAGYTVFSDIFNGKSIFDILGYMFSLCFNYSSSYQHNLTSYHVTNQKVPFDIPCFSIAKTLDNLFEINSDFLSKFGYGGPAIHSLNLSNIAPFIPQYINQVLILNILNDGKPIYNFGNDQDEMLYLLTPFALSLASGFSIMDVVRSSGADIINNIVSNSFCELLEGIEGTFTLRLKPYLFMENPYIKTYFASDVKSVSVDYSSNDVKTFIQSKFVPSLINVDIQNYGYSTSYGDIMRFGLHVDLISNPNAYRMEYVDDIANIFRYMSVNATRTGSINCVYTIGSNDFIGNFCKFNDLQTGGRSYVGYVYSEKISISIDLGMFVNLGLIYVKDSFTLSSCNPGLKDFANSLAVDSGIGGVNSWEYNELKKESLISYIENELRNYYLGVLWIYLLEKLNGQFYLYSDEHVIYTKKEVFDSEYNRHYNKILIEAVDSLSYKIQQPKNDGNSLIKSLPQKNDVNNKFTFFDTYNLINSYYLSDKGQQNNVNKFIFLDVYNNCGIDEKVKDKINDFLSKYKGITEKYYYLLELKIPSAGEVTELSIIRNLDLFLQTIFWYKEVPGKPNSISSISYEQTSLNRQMLNKITMTELKKIIEENLKHKDIVLKEGGILRRIAPQPDHFDGNIVNKINEFMSQINEIESKK